MGRENLDYDHITLARHGVSIPDGNGGTFKVDGSSQAPREPQGTSRASEDRAYYRSWLDLSRRKRRASDVWCSGCLDFHDPSAFSPDSRNADGIHSFCRAYRAKTRRNKYAAEKVSAGGRVRTWRKRAV